MKMKINILSIYFMLALVAGLCFSCSDDSKDVSNGQTMLYGSITTRASVYQDAEGDKELIKTWWIVFVNSSNKIAAIINRDDYKDYVVERDGFTLELANDTYDVYSFANIDKSTIEGLTGVGSLTVGGTMPDLSAVEYQINDLIANGTLKEDLSVFIPMTGKETITATGGRLEEDFEVIRMVAKVEFVFRNSCKIRTVTIKDLTFGPINEGNVLLMPDYSTLGLDTETNPVVPVVIATQTLSFTLPNPALDPNSHSIESYTHSFYIRESLAESHITKHFSIKMHIIRDEKPEELVYTMTEKDYTGINRNDYLLIPITFTDYFVDINVNCYPPIGGYPAVMVDKKPDEFYCTFSTGGAIEIQPVVKDAYTETDLNPSQYEYEILEINDPNELFSNDTESHVGKLPSIDPITGEIVGELNPKKTGTADIYIHVSIPTDPSHPEVRQEYWRRIYIIKKP
ncbi:MAG: hypothetical protein Q4F34_05480 [Prevotellaceae bacterium]|nr:hypothetical protein [Prevotellaceae bacterium]